MSSATRMDVAPDVYGQMQAGVIVVDVDVDGDEDRAPTQDELAEASREVLARGLAGTHLTAQVAALTASTAAEHMDGYSLYLADARRRYRRLSLAEAVEAGRLGDTTTLIECSTMLVLGMALRLYARARNLDLLELIALGNEALVKAAARYDYRRRRAFTTYAYWWIKKAMAREQLRLLDPFGVLGARSDDLAPKLLSWRATFEAEEGHLLSMGEVATLLRRRGVAAPRHAGAWPEAERADAWDHTRSGPIYLSQPVQGEDRLNTGTAQHLTWADVLRASDAGASESVAARDYAQLTRDLAALAAAHILRTDQVTLLVLRTGCRHPDPAWRAPASWQQGATHSQRLLATFTGRSFSTVQRRLTECESALHQSRRPDASRVLASLVAPALLVCRARAPGRPRKPTKDHTGGSVDML